jgi:catechol 2,3-dioxygenase-like lactoylglutathione lyase family enzyme
VLQHVSLPVSPDRVEACAAFYALLGFVPRPAPAGIAGRATWLERGPTQVHLLLVDAPATRWPGHLAVTVDDFDATLAALRAAGHDPEPRTAHWGAARAYVEDPAGQRVEVMASAPPPA